MIFICSHVCLVLLHSLWQMALLAAAAGFVGRVWRKQSVESRYALHVVALILGVALLPITYAQVQSPLQATTAFTSPAILPFTPPILAPTQKESSSFVETSSVDAMPLSETSATVRAAVLPQASPTDWSRFAPWLVGFYVVGVVLMLARLFSGIVQSRRIGSRAQPIIEGPLLEIVEALSKQWSLKAVPALAYAEKVVVPKVIGLVKPTILLPTSALTGLTASELEMILAHELAHVRRHDMGVYLFQRLAEAVLFFNPALWYLSRRISTLREYCCDEMTCRVMAKTTADDPKLRYAAALLRVVELAGSPVASGNDLAALAASGRSPSELRRRVARLFGEPLREPVRLSRGGVLMLAVMGLVLAIGPAVHSSATPSVEETEAETELEKPIVLEGSFADQVEAIVSDPFSKHPFSFMTDEEQEEIGPAFAKVVAQFIKTHAIDVEAIPVERRVAILSSLREKVNHFYGHPDDTPESRNHIYLHLPEQLKTFQWQVFMALDRGLLDKAALARQEKQREWMRDVIHKLPQSRGFTHEGVIADLDRQFRDPLNSQFDRSMSDERFLQFQQENLKYAKEQKNDTNGIGRPRDSLPHIVHYFLARAIKTQWSFPGTHPLFDEDKIGGYAVSGPFTTLSFASNRQHKGMQGNLETFDTRPVAIDAITGRLVSLADRNLRPQEALRRRQAEEGKGDFSYDDKGLFAVHDAKLLRLAVNDWPSADKISNEALRRKLKAEGGDLVPLNDVLAASLSRYDSLPFKSFDGIFVGVLTAEGKLSVVHIQGIYKEDIEIRVRPRSEQAEEIAATISGRIVLEDGSPATTAGWLYSESKYKSGPNSSHGNSRTVGQFTDDFSYEVHSGTVWLQYFPEGYAPAWIGPLELQSGQQLNDVTITLKPGLSELIRVTDEEGEPVVGAIIVGHPEINGKCDGPVQEKITDAKGEYLLEHLADTRYQFSITAPGYQPLRTAPLRLEAGEVLRPTMIRSRPNTGVVRFADGTPAPDTKILCKHEVRKDGSNRMRGGNYGTLFATCDSSGRFLLDQLADGSHYLFIVEAVDGARGIVTDLQAGQQDAQIVLPRRSDLFVKIQGDLSQLPKRNGKPFISVRQRFDFNPLPIVEGYKELIGKDAPIELNDEGGTAIFRGLAVDLSENAGPQQVEVSLNYPNGLRKIVDLNLTGATTVEFVLPNAKIPSDSSTDKTSINTDVFAAISGRIVLEDGSPAKVRGWMNSTSRRTNGNTSVIGQKGCTDHFSCQVPAGTTRLGYYSEEVAPTWIGPFELKPGGTLEEVTIVLKEGFSKLVKVVNEQGEPIAGATLVAYPHIEEMSGWPVFKKTTDKSGEYLLEHLADMPYEIRITAPGYETLQRKSITVRPGGNLSLTMIRSQPCTGVVRLADGTPAAGAKLYRKAGPQGDSLDSDGKGTLFATCDGSGRFSLDQLSLESHYLFVIETTDGTCDFIGNLQAGQKDAQIVLPKHYDLVVNVSDDLSTLLSRQGKPTVSVHQTVQHHPPTNMNFITGFERKIPIELTEKGGTAIFRGLATSLDENTTILPVQVTLVPSSLKRLYKKIDINPDGDTTVDFVLPDAKKTTSATTEADRIVAEARARTFGLQEVPRMRMQQTTWNADVFTMENGDASTPSLSGLWRARGQDVNESMRSGLKTDLTLAWDDGKLLIQNDSEASGYITKPPHIYTQSRYWDGSEGWWGETEPDALHIYRYAAIDKLMEHVGMYFPRWDAAGGRLPWGGPAVAFWGGGEPQVDPALTRYQPVGMESIDGVVCQIFDGPARHERLWVEKSTGLLKAVCHRSIDEMLDNYYSDLVKEVAGRTFIDRNEYQQWEKNQTPELRTRLSLHWQTTHWPLTYPSKLLVFSDYREIAPGVRWPMQCERVRGFRSKDSETGGCKYYRSKTMVTDVTEGFSIRELAAVALPKEGVAVTDRRFDPPIDYQWKEARPEAEILALWQEKSDQHRIKEDEKHQVDITPIHSIADAIEILVEGPKTDPATVWVRAIKYLVDHKQAALPALIEQLDSEERDHPIRKLAFTLRAIGDQRAVPALIRAFPKTLLPASSDCGIRIEDPELKRWIAKHDLGKGRSIFSYLRAFREVAGALHQLTGQDFGEMELNRVYLANTESQRRLQREQFRQFAQHWAHWWEANQESIGVDPGYSKVNLLALQGGPSVTIRQRPPSGSGVQLSNQRSRIMKSAHDSTNRCFLVSIQGVKQGGPRHFLS